MKILALDPATQFGWAVHDGNDIFDFGCWDCSSNAGELKGARFERARVCLYSAMLRHKPDLVVHEQVRRHVGTQAAHVYGGLMAVIQLTCYDYKMESVGLNVSTIKKHATGKGNAKKHEMVAAAQDRWPNLRITNDNEADAMWIADLAHKEYRP